MGRTYSWLLGSLVDGVVIAAFDTTVVARDVVGTSASGKQSQT